MCGVPRVTNPCIGSADSATVINFSYTRKINHSQLLDILRLNPTTDKGVFRDLFITTSENRPYGYLNLKLTESEYPSNYIIVPTNENIIPDLVTLVDKLKESTAKPQFFSKKGGARRRTRSRSYKKRTTCRRYRN